MRGKVGLVIVALGLGACEPTIEQPSARSVTLSVSPSSVDSRESSKRPPERTRWDSVPLRSARRTLPPTDRTELSPPAESRPLPEPPKPVQPEGEGHMILIEEPSGREPVEPPVDAHARTRESAGVRAGASDDNLQFGAFLGFLAKNGERGIRHDVRDRIVVKVTDRDGMPLANARLQVLDGERVIDERRTYADGRALLFPRELKLARGAEAQLRVRHDRSERILRFTAGTKHSLEVQLETSRPVYRSVPLDVVFIIDTTGSMQDEIDRLTETLDDVLTQVAHMSPPPDLRLGMVLYKDRDAGAQRTEVVPLTRNTSAFRWALEAVRVGGGDDYPEDVQAGLQEAMHTIKWRDDGIRLSFLIGDAPPHLDYEQPYTYIRAMRDAAKRGIKIAAIGASGLDLTGELVWRQIAQYTMSPFVFLTYGETADNEGSPSTVSHHVGSNWVAESLDVIVVRMIRSELQNYGPHGTRPQKDFIQASFRPDLAAPPVLEELFRRSVKQLLDYSVERIAEKTPTVLLPMRVRPGAPASMRDELQNHLELAFTRSRTFRLVEAEGDEALDVVVKAQFRERFDEETRVSLGKHVAAQLAVVSELGLTQDGRYEVLIRLIRLETNEVLSVSLLEIDARWGDGMMTASLPR